MDIRPLVEAVMETAGKIKNDNMSDQNFYKFQFVNLNRIAIYSHRSEKSDRCFLYARQKCRAIFMP